MNPLQIDLPATFESATDNMYRINRNQIDRVV